MANFLNINNIDFSISSQSKFYVDKSMLIKAVSDNILTEYRFMCVTRPRRFGKTMALSMLNAYYSKGCDSRDLFSNLKIAKDPSFETHLNKHNVIWIDLGGFYKDTIDKNMVLNNLVNDIIADLNEVFPNTLTKENTLAKAIKTINSKLGERFIFLIDEWDVIYRESKVKKITC